MKQYCVQIEVSGALAMYARPDTGASPTSYPAPPWSAAKGLLESIAFLSKGEAWFHPTRIELCRHLGAPGGRISFQRYAFNYGGPLRKELNVKNGTGMQVFATAIANPCYRIYAEIRGQHGNAGRNPRHYLQQLFERRIKQGRCHKTPALGWSEFTCDYWGPFRDAWELDDRLNLEIPSMLWSVWDQSKEFVQDIRIERGVLLYPS